MANQKRVQIKKLENKLQEIDRRQEEYYLRPEKNKRGNPFISIPHSLLDNPHYRNGFLKNKRFITYYWLRRNIVRGKRDNEIFSLFHQYWKKGELVTAIKLKKIAEDLAMPLSTVRGHIDQLEEEGIIKVDRFDKDMLPNGKRGEVYILGTCLEGNEWWFIDDVFTRKNKEQEE